MEILAPAGNLEVLKVAIQSGCDAVYISGKNFGARKFATNFSEEELIEAVNYAHLRGIKVYVTVNTIVYDYEWEELDTYLNFLNKIKVDAVIVQDLGVVHYIRKNFPTLVVHASTQMNIHNESGAKKLIDLGVKRVVLARETPIEQVKKIVDLGIEVEVFAHGALCYSYSGQCLMSYMIGSRSGNRGQCAQPCRKKYSLLENGKVIHNECSLLSMKDLCTIDYLEELKKIGVTSLKIEGRMKSSSYVSTVVKSYKDKLNKIVKNETIRKLSVVFNREFTKGYLFNEENNLITNIRSVNHQGVLIGKVIDKSPYNITLELNEEIKINDGIRIKGRNEVGFYVQNVTNYGKIYYINGNFKVDINDLVYKTVDNDLNLEVNELLNNERYNISLNAIIDIKHNSKLKMKLEGKGIEVSLEGNTLEEVAQKPINYDRIKDQIQKTDSQLVKVCDVIVNYDGVAFVRISDINALRRETLKLWIEMYLNEYQLEENDEYIINDNLTNVYNNDEIIFDFVVHNNEQLKWCLNNNFENVFTFFESDYPMYANHFHFEKLDNKSNLVHNLSDYGKDKILSTSCNIVNSNTLKLLNNFDIKGAYLSSELTIEDMCNLGKVKTNYSKGAFIYGASLMMVTKHCFISKLKSINKIKCGSCKTHDYSLLDEYGNKMNVYAKCSECPELIIRNYKKTNLIKYIKKLHKNGINRFMIVLTDETKSELDSLKKNILNNI